MFRYVCAFILCFSFLNAQGQMKLLNPQTLTIPSEWELPVYVNSMSMPVHRFTFPPFAGLPKKSFYAVDKEMEKHNWQCVWYLDDYQRKDKYVTLGMPIATSTNTESILITDITASENFPKTPLRYLSFTSAFILGENFNDDYTVMLPNIYAPQAIYLNSVHMITIEGYFRNTKALFKEYTFPNSYLTEGENIFQLVIDMRGYNEDIYSIFRGKPVVVKTFASNETEHLRTTEVLYRRSDYYTHTYYNSEYAPYPITRTIGKRIIISQNSQCLPSKIALYNNGYKVKNIEEGVLYDINRDGDLNENYILLFGGQKDGRDYPVLVVFNHYPQTIKVLEKDEIEIRFPYDPMFTCMAFVPFAKEENGVSLEESLSFNNPSTERKERMEEISRLSFVMPIDVNENERYLSVEKMVYTNYDYLGVDVYTNYLPAIAGRPLTDRYENRSLRIGGRKYVYYLP